MSKCAGGYQNMCLVSAIPWLERMTQFPEVIAALDMLRAEVERRDRTSAIKHIAFAIGGYAIVAGVVITLIVAAHRGLLG